MNTYPRLAEMGINNPEQILHFSVNSIDYTDYLRITYKRPKSSSRAFSHTYKFPRVQKTAKPDKSGDKGIVLESSGEFREAVVELQRIVIKQKSTSDRANELLDELHKLEEDFTIRCSRLRDLIGNIKDE